MNLGLANSMLDYPRIYAVKSFSDEVRGNSSSGGVFYELSSLVITKFHGIVYGCAFDSDQRAIHIRCTTMDAVRRCMGSKYSQSTLEGILSNIQDDLRNGQIVLFTGTPCQVAAIKKLCEGIKRGKLYTAEIICHGVLSPELFQEWLRILEGVRKKPVAHYEHRSKAMGWVHRERIVYSDGSVEQDTRWSEAWRRYFYDNRSLRPSCYCCPYATSQRNSDITMGDFWGIEDTTLSYFKDDLGVSVVLVNSEAGMNLLNALDVNKKEASLEDALPKNPQLIKSSSYKGDRSKVWEELHGQGFLGMVKTERFLVSLPYRVAAKIKHTGLRLLGK